MLLILFVFLIVIGIYAKQKIKNLDMIIIGFICILLFFATDVPDFENYERVYNYIGAGANYISTGVGWLYLCKLGNIIGFTYKEFEIAIFFVCALLIRSIINRFIYERKYQVYIWALYLLFPVLLECVQIRFFVAETIVLFSIPFLTEKKVLGYLKFLICLMFASSIHSATFFYILFILIPVLNKIKKMLMIIIFFSSIMILIGKDLIITIASIYLDEMRISRYLYSTDGVGTYGIIAYTATLLVFLLIAKRCLELEIRSDNKRIKDFLNFFYQSAYLSCLVLPLSTFDTNFFRVQRPMWLIMYIALAILRMNGVKRLYLFSKIYIEVRFLSLIMALCGFVFYICVFNIDVLRAFF